MNRLRTLLAAALLLLLCPLSLLAAPVAAPSAFDRFMALATGAGKTTVTLGSDGTPLAAPGVPTLQTDGGMPKVTTTGTVKNPAGNPVAVAATGRVKAKAIGGAIARFLGKAAPIGYWAGVGMAGYKLLQELGFVVTPNADGTNTVQKVNPNLCTTAPCYNYQYHAQVSSIVAPSAIAACRDLVAKLDNPAGYRYSNASVDAVSPFGCYARIVYPNGTLLGEREGLVGATLTPRNPDAPGYLPSSEQELIDAVAAKSGWPSSSTISQVLADSAAATGVKLETDPLTVTGPATSAGPQKVTQNTTNNTTKTENTTYNHTYNGDTVTTTSVTVTNITNNTNGQTISNETTTQTPDKQEDPPKVEFNDTPLPAQPKLYTPKYPNGLEGVWTQQKAALNATPLATLAGKLMPHVGNSGACPVMNIDLSLAVWADFGVRDVAPPCYVWDWARIIVLVGALLLARALIFGG